ncbi:hypothetical protein BGX31_007488 [Mortierella sp. GBA43]|nr:hypothetical protein BGX31_007488 [Mortierella sp. GBA43]
MLELVTFSLDNAGKTKDDKVASLLCDEAENMLSQAKRALKLASKRMDDQNLRTEVGSAYTKLGNLQTKLGLEDKAEASRKAAGKLIGDNIQDNDGNPPPDGQETFATVAEDIFPDDLVLPEIEFKPPEADKPLDNTLQLTYCLSLLQHEQPPEGQDPAAYEWLQNTKKDRDETDRLKMIAKDMVRAFMRDELKDSKTVTEIVFLAPVLEKEDFRSLILRLCDGVSHSELLDVNQLGGLVQLIHGANPGNLHADDLVKILSVLSDRLSGTHSQSGEHMFHLTLAVSLVLDAMAGAGVKGLDRVSIHEPLTSFLSGLKSSKSDLYLAYQAAYACQALICVPDNESTWQAAVRRTGKVIRGVSGLVSAVKSFDLDRLLSGMKDIHEGLKQGQELVEWVSNAVGVFKSAYEDISSVAEGGQEFLKNLKDGLSFTRRREWYTALRGADLLIQSGKFATFKLLVCKAPCRRDQPFQWGVCQRLGEIAANTMWDTDTRQSAVKFLGEIYQNDEVWGEHVSIKEWIINILKQLELSPSSETNVQFAKSLMESLRENGDKDKDDSSQPCEEKGKPVYPLKIALPDLTSPTLLERVQNRPNVEGNLRSLKKQRIKEKGNGVYIPPFAKASLQAADDAQFPLMEEVMKFLESDKKVFLLLGDAGAGKSTFNRELECKLWETCNIKTGRIPLHINLPAIEKPEHDMIAKQLRKAEFTEPQIREMKHYHKFVLLCDGYDESQQTQNLYMSNKLNKDGEWDVKMVISCRSEYIGSDYLDYFQPMDRNRHSKSPWFQEAAVTPFSLDQVKGYISKYVEVHQPLWSFDDYQQALELIPSLKDLVTNPFLMSLSLEVLPRMVDPGQHLSATRVTRVALYDHFIEQWLERSKKRLLGETTLNPQAKAVFDGLSQEGFTLNALDFLKKLCAAIYKEQNGHPIVGYARYKDDGTWKTNFFGREDEKQILLAACPLKRTGNQHRFIHRSVLEYGLALAVFDPRDWKDKATHESALVRRKSVSSVASYELPGTTEDDKPANEQEPDSSSPLFSRKYVSDSSLLQFLEERVVQEPAFKQLLFDYIEHSKKHKKWRIAAVNAITILIRAGVQFNDAQLQGIQIPGADLSYGVFDRAQLQGADLRGTHLRNVWLREANMTGARLNDVQFGELPFLQEKHEVSSCAYSRIDGAIIAVGLSNGNVILYRTSDWEEIETLTGHSEAVRSILFSPKNDWIASCSKDGTVYWRELSTKTTYNLAAQSRYLQSIAFSPQGDRIVSASDDYTVLLLDVATNTRRGTFTGHRDDINSVAFSPCGRQIVSASDDKTVRLWNVLTGECSRILVGHKKEVLLAIFSPSGKQIASSSHDLSIRLWDAVKDELCTILRGHESWAGSIVYSPQGDIIASASEDKTVRLWDTTSGDCRNILYGHDGWVTSVVYSPQGDLIVTSSDDKTVRLWDAKTGACRHILTGHINKVNNVTYSPVSAQVASCSDDKTVRLWSVAAGASRHLSNSHNDEIAGVSFSSKGHQIASCSEDNTIRLWDVETGIRRHNLRGHHAAVRCMAYSFEGTHLVSGSNDRTVRLWNAKTGELNQTFTGHQGAVYSVAYSLRGDRVASASEDKTVRLWDTDKGSCRQILTGHEDLVLCVAFSPKGTQVASGSGDHTVRLWVVETGICRRNLSGHTDWVENVVHSSDGHVVASASRDKTVRLWDVETGGCSVLIGHEGWIYSIKFSPQGDQIASASGDGTLRLWDAETGSHLQTLPGHSKVVTSIAYSPKGDLIASASGDCTLRLWDAASGQCLAKVEGYRDWIQDIDWVSKGDNHHLITGCDDGSMRLWDVIKEKDKEQYSIRLRWRSTDGSICVMGASIQGAFGLSQLNKQLLQQRGVMGEPVPRLREIGNKVIMMNSVVRPKAPLKAQGSRSGSST